MAYSLGVTGFLRGFLVHNVNLRSVTPVLILNDFMPRKVGPRVTGSWLHPNDKYKSIFFDIFAFYFLLAPKKTENESTIFNIFMSSLAPINHQNAIFLGFIGSCLVTSSVISPGGRKVGGLTCQWGSYIIDPHRKSNPSETIYIYIYIHTYFLYVIPESQETIEGKVKGDETKNESAIPRVVIL